MADNKGTIIYIGGFEMPDKNAAANRVLNNAKAFVELGYKVVFCGVDHDIKEDVSEVIKFNEFESWPSKYPTSTIEWIKEQTSFKHIEDVLSKYDNIRFIIGYNMHAIPLRNLEKWCKAKRVKLIIDATEWYPNKFSLKPGKLVRWADTNLAMRWYQKKADGVIAISSLLEKYYKKSVSNTIIIPPLVDAKESKWSLPVKISSKTIEFTYTGRAGNGKDIVKDKIDIVINVMTKLPATANIHFSVVGMTRKECEAMFEGMSEKIDFLGNKIDFYGKVSHEESVQFLRNSDYCIFLRERNRQNMAGFPTKFAECLTTGIGVVVNDISDIASYFPIENSILIKDIDEVSVGDAISRCINNGKVKHDAKEVFDFNRYLQQIDAFLAQVGE